MIASRGWRSLPEFERIGAVYDFVRNEIAFGYNIADDVPASRVLADGYGQCNTKSSLLMALLRGSGVPCRFHGATIHKSLQRGVVPAAFYPIAPESIVHSWVEVDFRGWRALEGVILDEEYLSSLQAQFGSGEFLGYGAGTTQLEAPGVEWSGVDTFIQRTGVNADLGVFDDPDAFYRAHGGNLSGLQRWLFAYGIRHLMNRRVRQLRRGAARKSTDSPGLCRYPEGGWIRSRPAP